MTGGPAEQRADPTRISLPGAWFSSMAKLSEQDVLDALHMVRDPARGQDIVALGMVGGVTIDEGRVNFALLVEPSDAARMEPVRKSAEDVVGMLKGVTSVTAVLTAHKKAEPPRAPQAKAGLQGVGAIVAVASGKGGVGKSTVAANLALGLKALGLRVGILDCDVYGPSMPMLMGVTDKPRRAADGRLAAPESYGVKVMSMGFLAPGKTPMIWRGPMVSQAVDQMLRGVAWEPLDVLVVDLPPGTGDAQLTLGQRVPLAGAVIVSTPQNVALLDARKGLAMFQQLDVPVLGIIENMSYFLCPHCGERTDIFSTGGAEDEAKRAGVDFLGAIPLDARIRDTSDSGRPITATEPDSPHAKAFREIAQAVWRKLSAETQRKPPRIVVN
jgi:ATP-binding protein involved in chromosome partitioning